ncbi:hypothetical protein O0I10_010690 [Lichtheimia ornata]|uniref:Uncharacterized protein n=1 Tax=Lichtheimia ornata TaxID=688661 RepID=A0AAD7UUE2_9FUNG|nr:uncharacterized protein O0I10_010690 [Lichtheimia ornata]KAJ8653652.1 hypothetical protein O0I10_010690 [Lichtheimia ornata]
MDIGQLDNPFKSKKKHDAKASPNPYQIGDYEDEQPSSTTTIRAEEKKSTKIVNKVKDEIHKAKTKAHSYHHHHNEPTKEKEEDDE